MTSSRGRAGTLSSYYHLIRLLFLSTCSGVWSQTMRCCCSHNIEVSWLWIIGTLAKRYVCEARARVFNDKNLLVKHQYNIMIMLMLRLLRYVSIALVSCGVHNVLTYHCCCPNIGSCVRVNKETGHCGTSGGHWMYWTTQQLSTKICESWHRIRRMPLLRPFCWKC